MTDYFKTSKNIVANGLLPRIAVHFHLYYKNQLEEILCKLRNLQSYNYDLYVSMVEENKEAYNKIMEFNPEAKIWLVPNLGYDVGPFIDFLHKIDLDSYDLIIKIHTKRTKNQIYSYFNKRRFSMQTWRDMLYDSILFSPRAVDNNIRILQKNLQVGMIGNFFTLTDEEKAYKSVENLIAREMHKIGLNVPENKLFIAGTMFMAKAKLFKPFLIYKITDFTPSNSRIHDGSLAHALERMFGWSVTSQGYKIEGVKYQNYILERFLVLKRFLYQKKLTKSGYLCVKICKIPIYYRKEKL